MFAMLLTFALAVTAIVALASIGHSLRRGISAAGALRRELQVCSDTRELTVWSAATGLAAQAERCFAPDRGIRRVVRPDYRPARQRQRVAA
jgi:hypothetical protein